MHTKSQLNEPVSMGNHQIHGNPKPCQKQPHSIGIDYITLQRRYPRAEMQQVMENLIDMVDLHNGWTYVAIGNKTTPNRFGLILPDATGQPSQAKADIGYRINTGGSVPTGDLRIAWNPNHAGQNGTEFLLQHIAAIVPGGLADFLADSFITRLDVALDLPGGDCQNLAAARTKHHKNARVFVGADGCVDTIEVGTRKTSSRPTDLLRAYNRELPAFDGKDGVRIEIQLNRPGRLEDLPTGKNRFAGYTLYSFDPSLNKGLNAALIALVRETGAARALKTLASDKRLATKLERLLAKSIAPWWQPEQLLEQAVAQTTAILTGSLTLTKSVPLSDHVSAITVPKKVPQGSAAAVDAAKHILLAPADATA